MKKNPILCATLFLASTTLLSAGPSSFNAGLTYESLRPLLSLKPLSSEKKKPLKGGLRKL
ncbi:MAG: hypothetical protein C0582_03440 [Alphaproteobacteria bacterium]|nr:MAG: hypothetical protein C0582_03440 [Alphaproteobacteria bacterium]